MPNCPMRAEASLLASSAASLSRNALRAGAGDGAKPAREVFAGHADAIVGEGQRFGVRIDLNSIANGVAVLDQFGPGDRFVAQLFAGVGGVGDKLADENLPVRIDRMDHEVQQARNIGLEALGGGFAGRGLGVGGQRSNLSKNGGQGKSGRNGAANRISGRRCVDASGIERLGSMTSAATCGAGATGAPARALSRPCRRLPASPWKHRKRNSKMAAAASRRRRGGAIRPVSSRTWSGRARAVLRPCGLSAPRRPSGAGGPGSCPGRRP